MKKLTEPITALLPTHHFGQTNGVWQIKNLRTGKVLHQWEEDGNWRNGLLYFLENGYTVTDDGLVMYAHKIKWSELETVYPKQVTPF